MKYNIYGEYIPDNIESFTESNQSEEKNCSDVKFINFLTNDGIYDHDSILFGYTFKPDKNIVITQFLYDGFKTNYEILLCEVKTNVSNKVDEFKIRRAQEYCNRDNTDSMFRDNRDTDFPRDNRDTDFPRDNRDTDFPRDNLMGDDSFCKNISNICKKDYIRDPVVGYGNECYYIEKPISKFIHYKGKNDTSNVNIKLIKDKEYVILGARDGKDHPEYKGKEIKNLPFIITNVTIHRGNLQKIINNELQGIKLKETGSETHMYGMPNFKYTECEICEGTLCPTEVGTKEESSTEAAEMTQVGTKEESSTEAAEMTQVGKKKKVQQKQLK